ncbi:glycosyltransferase [Horticoccus sp. 23ND18S-11]|uniref:glycosyltransferase n=1 Tax=Horticoccus sp. 23ND18S-11 TaxID=3391832 RepID=UPI0039C8FD9F
MILFDTTKTGAATHRSGLTRVSARLRDGLGAAAVEIRWDAATRGLAPGPTRPQANDWFLTAELFSEDERPGFNAFLQNRPCRLAAIFHDAIPLKHPHITWPQSVARHPGYMKQLARFDRVWAVSAASRDELLGFWQWQGVTRPPPVDILALGADFSGQPRVTHRVVPSNSPPQLLTLGILEPRKNQTFLLEVCADLWAAGLAFELHVVGRVNPHFGRPIVDRIKALQRAFPGALHFHEAANDATVAALCASARALVFPTVAEGCGLPLLEALWQGLPCVCSDLPVLRENADGGGCVPVTLNDRAAWSRALRRILTDDVHVASLIAAATTRALPTWADAAHTLAAALR